MRGGLLEEFSASWKARLAQLIVLFLSVGGILLANSAGPPLAHTGDFGQANCNTTGCHLGNPLNVTTGSLAGSLTLSVPAEYEPGKSYTITITLNKPNQRRWGFEFSARADSSGAQAGNLVSTNLFTQVNSQEGIQYITHTFAGTYSGDAGPKSWTFNWTAPSNSVGDVRFSCAANAANNNGLNTGDFIYTQTAISKPAAASFITSLNFPRLVTTNGTGTAQDDSEFTGLAVANLDSTDATLRFTAFDKNGERISGSGIGNPATQTLKKGEQLPVIDTQVFGSGLPGANPVGWIKVESTVNKVVGFFLMFNGRLDTMDGADVSSQTLTSFVLPEIEDAGFTQIHVANPNSNAATVTFELVKGDGATRASASRTVNSNSAVAELFTSLFPGETATASDYIRIASTGGVVPFEYLGKTGVYVDGLNGQDANAGATTLYCPQYVVGGSPALYRTTLSVINLDPAAGTVTFEFIRDDGGVIATKLNQTIAAKGKIYVTAQDFLVNAGATLTQGYLKITSSGIKLAGSVLFGDPERSLFSTALPLVSMLRTSMVFSQVASDNTFFTGLAILNPNSVKATMAIDVYDKEGNLIRTKSHEIPARQRTAQLLTQHFPELIGQTRSDGYIRITSDQPVASFALFGTNTLSVLSAVPPQVVP